MGQRAQQLREGLFQYDIVILTSLLWFMVLFIRFAYPPLFGTFQSLFGVSNSQTGLLFTLLMLGYASAQFPAGAAGDRFGHTVVIFVGAVGFGVAALLTSLSPTFVFLLATAVLFGIASGPHKGVTIPLLSDRYSENKGRALGTVDTVGQFGGMVAPVAVVALLSVFVWQAIFALAAIATIALAVLFYIRVKRDTILSFQRAQRDDTESVDAALPEYIIVFRDWRLLLFIGVIVLQAFAWNALAAFFPLYLSEEKGFTGGMAGILFSLLFVVSISQAVTGELSDRVGQLRITLVLFAGMAVGLGALVVSTSIPILLVTTIVLGISFHGIRPVRDSYLMELIPTQLGGGTLGLIRTIMTGIGALGPVVMGYSADIAGFDVAFVLITVITATGGVFSAVLLATTK